MTKKSEATKEVAEVEVDQDRVDRTIWKGLGVKSVRVIADEAGIKPEEVLRRKNELLDEVDVLTIQEKRQKLVIQLQQVAHQTQQDYEASPWEFKSGLMNSAVSAMKTLLAELNRAEKADNGKVEALNQLRIRELLRLIDVTVARSVREISASRGIPEPELMEVFQGHLSAAAFELESSS